MTTIARRPKPARTLSQHAATTSSAELQGLPRCQTCLRVVAEHDEQVRTRRQNVLSGGLAVLLLGALRGCCAWLLETPEIRDVLCRRIISGDNDGHLECRPLSNSAVHDLARSRDQTSGGPALGDCRRSAKVIFAGMFPPLDGPLMGKMLLDLPVLILRDRP